MKDLILERLNKIEDLEQRKLLKNIMAGVFTNLVDYQNNMLNELESRVFSETEVEERNYAVYFTICNKRDIDPVDDFMKPVFAEDVEEVKLDSKEVRERLKIDEEVKLFTIFMKCDNEKINELVNNKRKYRGELITDKRSYEIGIKLEQNRGYLEEIEKLYETFMKNNISWKTINNPYANKFFDVILTSCEEISDEEEIVEISFDLEKYEKYKMMDTVLLWNINRAQINNAAFPMPALDKVNYEHKIPLNKSGNGRGYLLNEDERLIRYIKLTEKDLVVVSPADHVSAWNIFEIVQPTAEQKSAYKHEPISNCSKESFIHNYTTKNRKVIKTKAEIVRLVNSFEVSKYFQLVSVEVKNDRNMTPKTYDMNYFIVDDIRMANEKKTMKLKFRSKGCDEYLTYDLMSFLVSEVQMFFPEYQCEGELI